MSTGPKENVATQRAGTTSRGGARPGSGPKPVYAFSDKERKALMLAARKYAKRNKKKLAEVLMDHIYCDDKRTSLTALKLYYDNIVVQASQKIVTSSAPAVSLPEIKPDPSRIVPIKAAGS